MYEAHAVLDPTDPTDDMHLFIALGWLTRMVAAACGDVQALWYGLGCLAELTLGPMYSPPYVVVYPMHGTLGTCTERLSSPRGRGGHFEAPLAGAHLSATLG